MMTSDPENPFEDEEWRGGGHFALNPLDSYLGWTCMHCSSGVNNPDVHYAWHRQMYLNDMYGGIVTRTPIE